MDIKYTFEQIEEYLADTMPAAEKQEFERELAKNQQLAAEVERQREAHHLVDLYTKVRIKEKVKDIYTRQESLKTAPVFTLSRIAAVVTLVVVAFAAYIYFYQTFSNDSMVAGNFEPYPNRFTTMGTVEEDPFSQGLSHYDKQEYQQALAEFLKVPDTSEHFVPAQLYLGIAYFSIDQYALAITSFERVQDSSSAYQEVGRWYLALSYLKAHRTEEATTVLRTIVGEQGYQAAKAQVILDRLESPVRNLPGI